MTIDDASSLFLPQDSPVNFNAVLPTPQGLQVFAVRHLLNFGMQVRQIGISKWRNPTVDENVLLLQQVWIHPVVGQLIESYWERLDINFDAMEIPDALLGAQAAIFASNQQ